MGRRLRAECSGSIYHVLARGNNKEFIFRDNIDKKYFLKLLKECCDGPDYKVYGYVLMENHYHIIIQRFSRQLQDVMHQINNKYSKYFNGKYERVGHVFQGRYKAILVHDDSYLFSLLRYVHQNPLKANICRSVENYEWSSDMFYRSNIKSFIHIDTILDMISESRVEAIARYRDYMNQEESMDYDNMTAIGEEIHQILSNNGTYTSKKSLDEILLETGVSTEEYQLIKSGKRRKHLTRYKLKYAEKALQYKYTYKEIGNNISITDTGIRNLLARS